MKKWAAAIAALGFIGVMGTSYASNIFPTGVMNKVYGKYNARFKCWIVKGGQLNRPHCMKPIALQQVSIEGKQVKFFLASGDEIDLTTGASGGMGAHVSGGLIGMFVYTGPDSSPRIIAQEPKKELGTYGDAPEGKFVKLGPDRYGWQFEMVLRDRAILIYGYSSIPFRKMVCPNMSSRTSVSSRSTTMTAAHRKTKILSQCMKAKPLS